LPPSPPAIDHDASTAIALDGAVGSLLPGRADSPVRLTGKVIAVVQSSYVPWKGYFDLLRSVDEFVLFDDVQFTRRDWRNRNKIKTPHGTQWLTIPVEVKGKYHQRIRDVLVSEPGWGRSHWKTLTHSYSRARHFDRYRETFEPIFADESERSLSRINHRFIRVICDILEIDTRVSWSSDYELVDGASERLVAICKQAGATEYLSGPSARAYLREELFRDAGIEVRYMDYAGYPCYEQLHPPFEHAVSVLDLIFNTGPDAPKYLDRA